MFDAAELLEYFDKLQPYVKNTTVIIDGQSLDTVFNH